MSETKLTESDAPNWPLPWHIDSDGLGKGGWTVFADNDWPVCHCEDERSAKAILALRGLAALSEKDTNHG